MLAQIGAQIDAPFDPWQHLDTVAEVLARYPEHREMFYDTVATCAFGMVLPAIESRREVRDTASDRPMAQHHSRPWLN
jgi:hypothetical protein